MDADEVLEVLKDLLPSDRLSPLDCLVFRQSWLGQTYHEMAKGSGYDGDYLKEVGFRLWNTLSEVLATRVTKKNLRLVLSSYSLQDLSHRRLNQQLTQEPILHAPEQLSTNPQLSSEDTHYSTENSQGFRFTKPAVFSGSEADFLPRVPYQRPDALDPLTQLTNQRYFNEYLEVHWQRWSKTSVPLSLILCEIDHFPFYQHVEQYLIGDAWIQHIGKAIGSCVRHYAEVVSRYGGTTFAALIPKLDAVILSEVAENLRESVKALTIQQNPVHTRPLPNLAITLSIGVASLAPAGVSPDALVKVAQHALMESKQRGGDRVTLGSHQSAIETL